MKRLLVVFLFFPFISFSQNGGPNDSFGHAIIKNLYPAFKNHLPKDSIKTIAYPLIYCEPQEYSDKINNSIKNSVFAAMEYDIKQSPEKLLQALYRKDSTAKIGYEINYNENGYLSITITILRFKGERKPPIYLNFDLTTGKLITLRDMLKTKNDSISFWHSVVPPITDSLRLFEQTLDMTNPKYSDIIERLNTNMGNFRYSYPSDFILEKRELIVYFDCILPKKLFTFYHKYREPFYYKSLRYLFKQDVIKRLINNNLY